jgi:2'-5' RNA ligase
MRIDTNGPKRCVFLVIQYHDLEIDAFRKKSDPLFSKCPPHITVAFPFRSSLEDSEIAAIMDDLCEGQPSIRMVLSDAAWDDGVVSFRASTQQAWLARAHETLTLSVGNTILPEFIPHFTIGREMDSHDVTIASLRGKSLEVELTRMVLEEIRSDESSKALHEVPLRT